MLSALTNKQSIAANAAPPPSATNFTLSVIAMSAGLALVWVTAYVPALNQSVPYAPLIPCLGIVMVIGVSEWLWPNLRSQAALAFTRAAIRPLDLRRVVIRIFGVIATLGLVAFAYWLLPEYGGTFYDPYWQFLRSIAPLAVVIPFYLLWIDRRIAAPHDDYYAFGALVIGAWARTDWLLIRRHLLGWTVKAFFLPLMTVYLADELRTFRGAFLDPVVGTMPLYQLFYHLSYFVDLMFCVVGYSAAIRLFDAQIRSVDSTAAGWVVALVCYQPFYSVIGRVYLQYDDTVYWDNWLQNWPVVRVGWAVAIIVLLSIYALCTVSFGLRFSNLTHRGIITGGPYRFTKHPAYWAKNLSWWLISVPFVSEQGWSQALRNCCLLGLVNLVYYVRARTEEQHLSRDPTYVAYALWINEHGLLRALSRLLPFARYRAPEHIIHD
jgi:isoprenylcysteine carboxyl methyltransferase (ICMT) family protein YpbQ